MLPAAAVAANPTNSRLVNPAWKLPIIGLGPFGPTNRCSGDMWPAGHCALKTTANLAAPEFWQTSKQTAARRWQAPGLLRLCAWAIHMPRPAAQDAGR